MVVFLCVVVYVVLCYVLGYFVVRRWLLHINRAFSEAERNVVRARVITAYMVLPLIWPFLLAVALWIWVPAFAFWLFRDLE